MKFAKHLCCVIGLFLVALGPKETIGGIVVSDSGFTDPLAGVVPVPPGGFTLSDIVDFRGYIDFTYTSLDPSPMRFIYDFDLVVLRPGGGWDVFSPNAGVGGAGIPISPGDTFRSTFSMNRANYRLLNSMVEPGQTELNFGVVVTRIELLPPHVAPEPSSVALLFTGAPIGLLMLRNRRRNAA